jgi:hypothetical protein
LRSRRMRPPTVWSLAARATEEKTMSLNQLTSTQILPEPHARTFRELIPEVQVWDSEFLEMESVPVERVEVTEEGLTFDKSSIPMDQDARSRLFTKVGAPESYLAKRSIALQIIALREHLGYDFGDALTPVLRHGSLFTLQSNRLSELTHFEVLTAIADALGESTDGLTVSKVAHLDGQLELDLVSQVKSLEVRRGDIVTAGLHIDHCRYGDRATQVQAFIYRRICSNGMTRRECVSEEGIVRTRRLPVDHPHAKELQLDQIRRLTARTFEKLEPKLLELQATNERRADVPQLLGQWMQRARISTRVTRAARTKGPRPLMARVLKAWRDSGSEDTWYAAVNALTFVGSHDPDLSQRQRRLLSSLGGLLAFSGLHICPRCFSVLSDSNHIREDPQTEAEVGESRIA